MRRHDKLKNIERINLLTEQRYLKSKGFLKETVGNDKVVIKESIQYKVTNNFDNSVFFTSSTGQDLKDEIRAEARKLGKLVTDFKVTRV